VYINASHQSSTASEAVHDVLARTIPTPNSTRWNSDFDSYCVIYDVTDKVNVVMGCLQLPKFSSQDFAFLGEWIAVMKPITHALDKMQGENTMESYFGSILPTLCVIQWKLTHTASLVSALVVVWRSGNVTSLGRSTKLLYARPG